MTEHTRRAFVTMTGTVALGATGVTSLGAAASEQQTDSEWTTVDSPTPKTLNSAVETVEGPVVVGGGGDVLVRRQSGWEKIVEFGPQARSRPLTGADVTDDGHRVWFVGGSGVIGEYDVVTRTLTNYSAPRGITSTWEDCAVQGTAGENERLYFANGSGELLVGDRQESGAVEYRDIMKPGGGSTIPGIDFHARDGGHVCSTSQFVAETADGGSSWNQIGIGFSGASFFDVASEGPEDVNVGAGAGIIYRYDGFRWTPHVVDDERQAIRAVDRDPDGGLAAGAGGKVYERESTGQWRRMQTPVSKALIGVARTSTYDVAVGGGGTIVERAVDRSDGDGGGGNATATATTGNATAPRLSDRDLTPKRIIEGTWTGF